MVAAGEQDKALEMVLDLLFRVLDDNARLVLRAMQSQRAEGRKSERVTEEQLNLLMKLMPAAPEAPGTSEPAEPAATPQPAPKPEPPKPPRQPRSGEPPPGLQKRQKTILVPAEERCCKHCAQQKTKQFFEMRWRLNYEPALLVVEETRYEKLSCTHCQADTVTAPAAPQLIEGGRAGTALLAEVMVAKYGRHAPLTRQSAHYGELGYAIPVSTLCDWVASTVTEVEPLYQRIIERVFGDHVLHIDGTGLRVLDRNHPDHIRKGAMWCYVGRTVRLAFFKFISNKDTDGPVAMLKDRKGFVVADADLKLNALFGQKDATAVEVGCNMHARRYYVTALDSGDLRAIQAVKIYKQLYKVEKEAKAGGLHPDAIRALRQVKSKPLLEELGRWARDSFALEDPKSPLGKAWGYMVRQWAALTRFLEDGTLPIDNGAAERALRGLALGRLNYLFAGSDAGAQRAAVAYTFMVSCRLHHLDVGQYWRDILHKLAHHWPPERLDELIPDAWARQHPEHVHPHKDQFPQIELHGG